VWDDLTEMHCWQIPGKAYFFYWYTSINYALEHVLKLLADVADSRKNYFTSIIYHTSLKKQQQALILFFLYMLDKNHIIDSRYFDFWR
jgi:hypothetical protein